MSSVTYRKHTFAFGKVIAEVLRVMHVAPFSLHLLFILKKF